MMNRLHWEEGSDCQVPRQSAQWAEVGDVPDAGGELWKSLQDIWIRIRSLLGICRDRHAAGSTCSCSTHRLSSSPASWSPDVPMSMWLRNNVRLTSLKNFSKVHIFWGLTSSRPAKIGVRCFLIPGRANVWKKSKEQIWDENLIMRWNDNFVRLFLTLWEKTRVGQLPTPLDRAVLNSLHPWYHPTRLRRQHWKEAVFL